jgi:hypothetical protein
MPIAENTLAGLAGGITKLGERLQENRKFRLMRFLDEEKRRQEQEDKLALLSEEWEERGAFADESIDRAIRQLGETREASHRSSKRGRIRKIIWCPVQGG